MIRNRHNDYRAGIQQNRELAMNFASSLQEVVGELHFDDDEDLKKEFEDFVKEQKQRLVKIAEQNVEQNRKVDSFVAALSTVHDTLNNQTGQMGSGNYNEQDYEKLLASEIAKAQQTTSMHLDLSQETVVREMQNALGLQTTVACNGGDDDELEVLPGASTQSLKCPLAGGILLDPVKNKVCKHVYSKHALEAYVAQCRGRNCTCPVVGCSNSHLTLISCEPDIAMTMKVKRHERRQAHEQEMRMSQAANVDSEEEEME